MSQPTVVISGAGIAGPALAFWLNKSGYRVTIVELADGSRRADMPVTAFNGNGLVSKLEILRGDVVDVLYRATKNCAEYRFNTGIEDLNQTEDAVQATLSDGTTLSADLASAAMDRIRRCGALCRA
jgi:2-polyprenyl-6-methoxyphenol hydroxylase-like FAD-dependent oxidoreductase